MESNITPTPQDKQVTVDVPEDRIAEFHAFFARFLAAPYRRGRGGRRGRPGHGPHGRHGHHRHEREHGRGCGHAREDAQPTEQSAEVTEV
jgi:hypothetical protein